MRERWRDDPGPCRPGPSLQHGLTCEAIPAAGAAGKREPTHRATAVTGRLMKRDFRRVLPLLGWPGRQEASSITRAPSTVL